MKNSLFTLLLTLSIFHLSAQNCKVEIKLSPASPVAVAILTVESSPNDPNTKYLWSTGQTAPKIIPAAAGDYCVTATLSNGCTASSCHTVTDNDLGFCSVKIQALGDGSGALVLKAGEVFVATTKYQWSTGETAPTITVFQPGDYCVTATQSTGCVSEDCFTVQTNNALEVALQFNGATHANVAAEVFLIKYSPAQGGVLEAVHHVDTKPDGTIELPDLTPGPWLVKAALKPNSPDYANFLPTYAEKSLLWSDASEVKVRPFLFVGGNEKVVINMVAGQNPGGPGFIGGLVSQGANLTGGADDRGGEGDPIANVSIVLETEAGIPVAAAKSAADGKYSFSNLAWGDYKVTIDIPGIPVATARVSINPNTPNIPTVNFKVDDDSSVVPVYEAGEGLAFSVSPNPVASDLTVKLPFKSQTSLTISNLQGQTVLAVSTLDPVVQLPVQFLPAGVYLLTARSGEQVLTEKIVRQ